MSTCAPIDEKQNIFLLIPALCYFSDTVLANKFVCMALDSQSISQNSGPKPPPRTPGDEKYYTFQHVFPERQFSVISCFLWPSICILSKQLPEAASMYPGIQRQKAAETQHAVTEMPFWLIGRAKCCIPAQNVAFPRKMLH